MLQLLALCRHKQACSRSRQPTTFMQGMLMIVGPHSVSNNVVGMWALFNKEGEEGPISH